MAERYDWYIFPVTNPDGFVYSHTTVRKIFIYSERLYIKTTHFATFSLTDIQDRHFCTNYVICRLETFNIALNFYISEDEIQDT